MKEEKPPLLYDVVYPKDFISKIKKTGKYDILDLARKGMVICFEILLPKEKIDEGIKQVASMFHRSGYEHGVILCDIDEWVENANTAFKFAKETGKIGELPLMIFETTQYLTDWFSKEKQKELDKKEQTGQRPSGGYVAKPVKIENKKAEKRGMEHWLLFVSTHDYLVEGYFLDTLIEIHSKNFHKLMDKMNPNEKKTETKRQSKRKVVPDIPISDGKIPLVSSGFKDKKSITMNWSKFKSR